MTSNIKKAVDACAGDPNFRDILLNHSTDKAKVSQALDDIKLVFKDDAFGFKKQAVINYIAAVDWSELANLEDATSKGDGVAPVMG